MRRNKASIWIKVIYFVHCNLGKISLQIRAQIEQEYGERLLRLAATSKIGEHEEGSFAETLSRIPSTLETTGRAHIDLAQQLRDHLEIPLDGFLKEQREIRKKVAMTESIHNTQVDIFL